MTTETMDRTGGHQMAPTVRQERIFANQGRRAHLKAPASSPTWLPRVNAAIVTLAGGLLPLGLMVRINPIGGLRDE